MNIKETCRDLNELNPLVRVALELALIDIRKQGINPLVGETFRPAERQKYLYCQGRTILECIAQGISKTFAAAYTAPKAQKVTWTLDSIHIQRKAVDVVPQRVINGKMTAIWNSQDIETRAIINTMAKYGFEPGANWKTNPDSPHFQVKGDFDTICRTADNIRRDGKVQFIPSRTFLTEFLAGNGYLPPVYTDQGTGKV